jgi:hypothetical protein
MCLRLNLAKHTSEDSEFRVFCKQAFVFQGHFDAVDCVFTNPQSLAGDQFIADDASVDSDDESDGDGVDDCDDDASDAEHNDDEND